MGDRHHLRVITGRGPDLDQAFVDAILDRKRAALIASHDRLDHDGTGCGCLDALDALEEPEITESELRLLDGNR